MAPLSEATDSTPAAATTGCSGRLQAIETVLLFFGVNVLAHCLTMKEYHGQNLKMSVYRALLMLISPVTSGTRTFFSITLFVASEGRAWIVDPKNVSQHGWSWIWERILHFGKFWAAQFTTSLQPAIAARAVAVYVPPEHVTVAWSLGWVMVTPSVPEEPLCQRPKLSMVDTSVPLTCLFYIPYYAKTTEQMPFVSGTSAARTATAIFQLLFSTYTLLGTHRPDLEQQGLSSPYVLVVPFLVMSLLNLISNLLVPTYPFVYVLGPDQRKSQEPIHPESHDPAPTSRHVEAEFIGWAEKAYSLKNIRDCLRWSADELRICSTIANTIVCSSIITAILLPITKLHIEDTVSAATFVTWIYVFPASELFVMLATTRFRMQTTDQNLVAKEVKSEADKVEDLSIHSWNFVGFVRPTLERLFAKYCHGYYQRPLTLEAHRRLGMYIALVQDAFRMLAPLGLTIYVAARASKLVYDASLQCP